MSQVSGAWGAGRIGRDNAYVLPASVGIVLALVGYAIATGNWCTGNVCMPANAIVGGLFEVSGAFAFAIGCFVIYRHWKKYGWSSEP